MLERRKRFDVTEDDGEIVTLCGEKEFDRFVESIPIGCYLFDKEGNKMPTGYKYFSSGEMYFVLRPIKAPHPWSIPKGSHPKERLEAAMKCEFCGFGNFARKFYILKTSKKRKRRGLKMKAFKKGVQEECVQQCEFDLSMVSRNKWILGEIKNGGSNVMEAARMFASKCFQFFESMPHLYTKNSNHFKKVPIEMLTKVGQIEVWYVAAADNWNQQKEMEKIDSRALFSLFNMKYLKDVTVNKVIICTRDELGYYVVQQKFSA